MLNQQPTTEAIPQPEQREPFVIDSQEKAAWAMRKLAKIRQKQAENTNTANAMLKGLQEEMDSVKAWEQRANQEEENNASWFIGGLERYYKRWLEENPKARTKTLKFPHGQLKSREQKPEFILDKDTLMEWAKANKPDAIKTISTTAVDWAGLKDGVAVSNGIAILKETGEVVGGVTVQERPAKFEIVTG